MSSRITRLETHRVLRWSICVRVQNAVIPIIVQEKTSDRANLLLGGRDLPDNWIVT